MQLYIRTDEYSSHKTDHVQALTDDLAPYLDTIKSLKMIFTRTQHQETYDQFVRETLEDAKDNPDEYRDLVVRVAGYSAYFTELNPELQVDLINRTE